MIMEILLNPGPVNLSQRVRNALLKPDLCHREIEFADLQNSIREKLLNVYGLSNGEWATVLLTGSGTSAMEAMITSMVPADGKILIIENGVYGERCSKIAEIYNIEHEVLHHEWGQDIDLEKLNAMLSNDIDYVVLVHHETTTGKLNEIATIATACKSKNIPLLLDGVSSFGAEEICFNEWNIAACAATANKCLHSIPGASFVIVNRKLLANTGDVHRSLYLDLDIYLKQQDKGATPFTQSVQCFYALDEALNEHQEEGGWNGRQATYRERMNKAVEGLLELGITPLLKDGVSSCVLNAFHLPEGISYKVLHDALKDKGFIIYAGQGDFAKSIFRISLMGAISNSNIDRFLTSFQEIIKDRS